MEKLGEGNELKSIIADFKKVVNALESNRVKGFTVETVDNPNGAWDTIKFGTVKIEYAYNSERFTITKDGRETSNQEQCLQILQEIMPELRKKCGIVSVEDVTAGILSQLRFLGNDN